MHNMWSNKEIDVNQTNRAFAEGECSACVFLIWQTIMNVMDKYRHSEKRKQCW